MAKKILLIDHDSHMPNIALMKLSTHHKRLGNDVFLDYCYGKPDFTYISKIFRSSPRITFRGPCEVGGTGNRDITKKLPPEIERLMPDYELYGTMLAHGFTSRGCQNNCPFCYVPKKEGKWHAVGDLYSVWYPGLRGVKFFDNNVLYDKDHFMKISSQVLKEKVMWDFVQGSDIRGLDRDCAIRIGEMVRATPGRLFRFAFDNSKQRDVVLSGVDLLLEYVEPKHLFCYVLIGYDSTYEQDLMRVMELKKRGIYCFPMLFGRRRYSDKYDTELLRLFKRWVRFQLGRYVTFKDYLIGIDKEYMIKYIGQEMHMHKIKGPRPDGVPRKFGKGFYRKKWICASGSFFGLY